MRERAHLVATLEAVLQRRATAIAKLSTGMRLKFYFALKQCILILEIYLSRTVIFFACVETRIFWTHLIHLCCFILTSARAMFFVLQYLLFLPFHLFPFLQKSAFFARSHGATSRRALRKCCTSSDAGVHLRVK